MKTEPKAKIIYIEGPKGSGKDHTINNLTTELESKGIKFKVVREPGGADDNPDQSPMAVTLRELLKGDIKRHRKTEALMYQAARVEMFENEIRPLLEEEIVIIVNRSIFSSMVTQQALHGVDFVRQVHTITAGDYTADTTIWLLPGLDVVKERRKDRNGNFDNVNPEDAVRDEYYAYLYMCQTMGTIGESVLSKRHRLVDTPDENDITREIIAEMKKFVPWMDGAKVEVEEDETELHATIDMSLHKTFDVAKHYADYPTFITLASSEDDIKLKELKVGKVTIANPDRLYHWIPTTEDSTENYFTFDIASLNPALNKKLAKFQHWDEGRTHCYIDLPAI